MKKEFIDNRNIPLEKWQSFFVNCKKDLIPLSAKKELEMDAKTLEIFFDSYRKATLSLNTNIPLNQWRTFFEEYKKYPVSITPKKEMDLNATQNFFDQYKKAYLSYRKEGRAINVREVAGLKTNEVHNTAVLAWLLNYHGSHGQGNLFLKCFLDSLKYFNENKKLFVNQITESHIKKSYRTRVEEHLDILDDKEQNSRIDITIENENFLLFIEVKIYALEGENQLTRYHTLLAHKSDQKVNGLVFLTRSGKKAKENPDEIGYLNWRSLAAEFEKALINNLTEKDLLQLPYWKILVLQFCQHIRSF